MNRKYTREWYLDRVAAIKRIIPDCGLTTGSRTFGIFEHESSIVSALFHQGERESVVFLRFGVENTREWYLDRVAAIKRIIPDCGLTTDIFSGFHSETDHFQRFVTHILRMRGSETDAYSRSSFGHRTEQHREGDDFTW